MEPDPGSPADCLLGGVSGGAIKAVACLPRWFGGRLPTLTCGSGYTVGPAGKCQRQNDVTARAPWQTEPFEPRLMTNLDQDAKTVAQGSSRLCVQHITKRYPGVLALSDVSLSIMPGETLAVIGENGAGKSTLMKTLAGIVRPDSGAVLLDQQVVEFRSPGDAIAHGVSLIHQELNLHENLSVAENVFLGREPSRFGFTRSGQMAERAEMYLQRVGLEIDPKTSLGLLSTAERQLVEVAKALSTNARVVIMDEPTSSLSTRETDRLFGVVDSLKADNVSVVYISHRLGEVIRLADRVEVMRDGKNAGQLTGDQINHDKMVSAMVGRDVSRLFDRKPHPPGQVRLLVDQLKVDGAGSIPVSFQVHAGEIVGIAGLVGSGRSELLEAIFGMRPVVAGAVKVHGRNVRGHCVRSAIKAGLALVPEDRKRTGLLLESTVRENATIAAMKDAVSAPLIDFKWQQSATAKLIDQLSVKTASQLTVIANLSGGNQQKIALGKWLIREPEVLMLDEPTRGVDVGAKQEIYTLLDKIAAQGLAVLFVSSEMDEVISLADRVLVMHEGGVAGELSREELSEEALMRFAVGITEHQEA